MHCQRIFTEEFARSCYNVTTEMRGLNKEGCTVALPMNKVTFLVTVSSGHAQIAFSAFCRHQSALYGAIGCRGPENL